MSKRLSSVIAGENMVLSNMFQYGDLTPKENMELLKKMLHRVPTHTPDESVVKKEFLDALDFYSEQIEQL